jgi:hypothetical protein
LVRALEIKELRSDAYYSGIINISAQDALGAESTYLIDK